MLLWCKKSITLRNSQQIDELISNERRVFVYDMEETSQIDVGNVEHIIHHGLKYRRICAAWNPRLLSVKRKDQRVQVSTHLLNRFHQEGIKALSGIKFEDSQSIKNLFFWKNFKAPKKMAKERTTSKINVVVKCCFNKEL